jgi:peptide/nickel transport system ATP-binding protein
MTFGEKKPVLAVRDLTVEIEGRPVVDNVSLEVAAGATLALVGESGSGKSMTALAIADLLPDVASRAQGTITLDGERIDGLGAKAMDAVRGRRLGMIFQEPVASLDPLMPVGRQIEEALTTLDGVPAAEARRRAVEMLARVGIPDPETRAGQYPFELSGGMCQRVMIAIAMIRKPLLLIADEPTTALDVTIQAQILEMMATLRSQTGSAVMLITHDMGVVAEIADTVAVMYAGRIVEQGAVAAVFRRQLHPYTAMLLNTIPRLTGDRKKKLPAIEGAVPDVSDWPAGCRFHPRCPLAIDICRREIPPLRTHGEPPETGDERPHRSACWRAEDTEALFHDR